MGAFKWNTHSKKLKDTPSYRTDPLSKQLIIIIRSNLNQS